MHSWRRRLAFAFLLKTRARRPRHESSTVLGVRLPDLRLCVWAVALGIHRHEVHQQQGRDPDHDDRGHKPKQRASWLERRAEKHEGFRIRLLLMILFFALSLPRRGVAGHDLLSIL